MMCPPAQGSPAAGRQGRFFLEPLRARGPGTPDIGLLVSRPRVSKFLLFRASRVWHSVGQRQATNTVGNATSTSQRGKQRHRGIEGLHPGSLGWARATSASDQNMRVHGGFPGVFVGVVLGCVSSVQWFGGALPAGGCPVGQSSRSGHACAQQAGCPQEGEGTNLLLTSWGKHCQR